MAQDKQCSGVVRRWIQDKGFGFLMQEGGGDDIYVHRSDLVYQTDLSIGEKVCFQKVDDGKKRGRFKAVGVIVTDSSSAGCIFADVPPAPVGAFGPQPLDGVAQFLEVAQERRPTARAALEQFIFLSSLQCPFLVLSVQQLVMDVRRPTPEEFTWLLWLVESFVTGCESLRAVLLVDFEGEMPGHGGELTTAQLQISFTVDAETLVPRALPASQRYRAPGLFIDLRCPECIGVVRRILQSRSITKILWGSRGDCQSLLYQTLPVPLHIDPAALVDAQIAFDTRHPIGMSGMLKHVPQELLVGLPEKEQIDWDSFHSRNCRALRMPLNRRVAAYAVDDLHRIEAIIGSKAPPSGSYKAARDATARMLSELRKDPCGLKTIQEILSRFDRREGTRRTVKAVELARHILSIRNSDHSLSESDRSMVKHAEDCALAELRRVGVAIPQDLSFARDSQDVWQASDAGGSPEVTELTQALGALSCGGFQ